MGKHKKHEEHEEHVDERWLLSYADMITLLFVLFVVLFAIGQTDLAKFAALKKSFHSGAGGQVVLTGGSGVMSGSDGVLSGAKSAPPTTTATPPKGSVAQLAAAGQQALVAQKSQQAAATQESNTLAGAQAQIQAALTAAGLTGAVQYRTDSRGLTVTIVADSVLFSSGSAGLNADGSRIIDAIAPALLKLPNLIAIEGHTDNTPVSGQYASNWELSTARATSVLKDLISVHHFPGVRLGAAGYADQRPIVPNDTPAHRAENRRVEVVVLSTTNPTH